MLAEDKRERLSKNAERAGADEGDEVEREDEQPTVVVLKVGDVGPEEFKAYRQQINGMITWRAQRENNIILSFLQFD